MSRVAFQVPYLMRSNPNRSAIFIKAQKKLKRVAILALYAITTASFLPLDSSTFAQDIYNPHPTSGLDFTLPMPNGAAMVFVPVFLGEGDDPFALKKFKVGDRVAGGYKEYPADIVMGGSFVGKSSSGGTDWMFYMGKYEVSEAQYYSIMDSGRGSQSQAPITNISWFDAQEFLHRYNVWLRQEATSQIPALDESLGFLRLPTEFEWEFAARGGVAVDHNTFDQKHPYPDSVVKYEWFSGAKSSRDKKKDIGTREPNPLGLHDMLGNVSEMTSALYQIEYYQGRTGGFVARGGHYLTSETALRSSYRNEVPFYGKPNQNEATRQATLGFRCVISSPVFSGKSTSTRIESAWEHYLTTSRQPPVSAQIRQASTVTQTNAQLTDAMESLERLDADLRGIRNVPDSIWNQLGLLKASFTNIESIVKAADHESAFASIKIASEAAFFIYKQSEKLPHIQNTLRKVEGAGMSATSDGLKQRIGEINDNIRSGLARYADSFRQMERLERATLDNSMKKYESYLLGQGAAEQLRVNELVKKHLDNYLQTRRSNADLWLMDIQAL